MAQTFFFVPVFVTFLGSIVAIVWAVAFNIRKALVAKMEATLKMEMIQRGMSAQEIQQVLSARMDSLSPVAAGH